MASRRNKRPPLQLHFTVQGGKKVLPLTSENVACVFKTGVLTRRYRSIYINSTTFAQRLGIPESITDPVSAAAWWVDQGKDRRWRVIIFLLDGFGETGLADELMPYSEPPSDPSLTAERVIPILMELEKWWSTPISFICGSCSPPPFRCGTRVLVPGSRADIIRRQHTSADDQKKKAFSYYVTCHPDASWGNLVGGLYQAGEKRAIHAFKAQFPKPKNPTLTVDAMMTATNGAEIIFNSYYDGYLDMAESTFYSIVEKHGIGEEGKRALFSEFLFHHPYPRWEAVIELLERLERMGKIRAGLAQEVKEKYLTSVHSLFNLCVVHILNNYEFYQPLLPQVLPHQISTHITSLAGWQRQEEKEQEMSTKQKVYVPDYDEI